jgi:hypothetical protein
VAASSPPVSAVARTSPAALMDVVIMMLSSRVGGPAVGTLCEVYASPGGDVAPGQVTIGHSRLGLFAT